MHPSTIETGHEGDYKWSGIASVGETLFCAPHNASSVLVIDAKTKADRKSDWAIRWYILS